MGNSYVYMSFGMYVFCVSFAILVALFEHFSWSGEVSRVGFFAPASMATGAVLIVYASSHQDSYAYMIFGAYLFCTVVALFSMFIESIQSRLSFDVDRCDALFILLLGMSGSLVLFLALSLLGVAYE